MPRWMPLAVGAFFVVYCIAVLVTGNPSYIIPVAILAVVVLAGVGANRLLTRRVAARHDSVADAVADERDLIPSAHAIPDDDTPLGDTTEAHDEISPHDLPVDHPGRREAERQATDRHHGEEGTTRGSRELLDR
jgi:hypothetical protein